MPKRGAVILAAGQGARLGGVAKALLRGKSGLTFLEQIVTTARIVGLDATIVVAGPPHGIEVANHARELGLDVIVNPRPERGMASSIALGFAALSDTSCEQAWLWPVDHPDVSAQTLSALIGQLGTHDAVRPVVGIKGGHPPLVARSLWTKLAGCAYLPNGARDAFAGADLVDVLVTDVGCVRDVDTALDLEAIR